MRKIGVAALVALCLVTYFWLGGRESPAPPTTGSAGQASHPSAPAHEAKGKEPFADRITSVPQGRAQPAPPPFSAPGAFWPSQPEGAVTFSNDQLGNYRFRPLDQDEKAHVEQRQAAPYAEAPFVPRAGSYADASGPYTVPAPYSPPAAAASPYQFRPFDQERAEKRWTGNFPPPAAYPTYEPKQFYSPYAPPEPAPSFRYQNAAPLAGGGAFWAARNIGL